MSSTATSAGVVASSSRSSSPPAADGHHLVPGGLQEHLQALAEEGSVLGQRYSHGTRTSVVSPPSTVPPSARTRSSNASPNSGPTPVTETTTRAPADYREREDDLDGPAAPRRRGEAVGQPEVDGRLRGPEPRLRLRPGDDPHRRVELRHQLAQRGHEPRLLQERRVDLRGDVAQLVEHQVQLVLDVVDRLRSAARAPRAPARGARPAAAPARTRAWPRRRAACARGAACVAIRPAHPVARPRRSRRRSPILRSETPRRARAASAHRAAATTPWE